MHIEDNTLDVAEGDEPPPPPPQATIIEAFQHFACLYIKYVQIFKRLEMCYDAMVHPQKRIDVKVMINQDKNAIPLEAMSGKYAEKAGAKRCAFNERYLFASARGVEALRPQSLVHELYSSERYPSCALPRQFSFVVHGKCSIRGIDKGERTVSGSPCGVLVGWFILDQWVTKKYRSEY